MIRTLIVDDEKLARKGLIAMLPWKKFDMEVVGEAANGEEALKFIEDNKVDLIITDMSMPVMSGLELIKRVSRQYPYTWLVICTCHQEFDYVQEAIRLGAIDYIVKTQLNMEDMDDVLRRISDRIRRGHNNRISEQMDLNNPETEASEKVRSRYSDEMVTGIRNSLDYIRNNLGTSLNQNDVARAVNISRGYFSQCFKGIVGKSFSSYVRDLQIEKAKELLIKTNKPIYRIAEELGFEDEKYFSRIFHEITGNLPTEHRNKRV